MTPTTPSFELKYNQPFFDAVPHMMRGTVTALDSRNPDVGIGLDRGAKDPGPSERDIALAAGATPSMHCFYRDGKTRYFISTDDPVFQAFKDKLLRECQLQSILCDEQGYVLDGYARWIACQMLHLEPKYTIVGNLTDDDAKITFVRSQKLCRHNLTEAERMGIVKDEIVAHPKRSISWTASLLGVSRTTVHKYRKELEGVGLVPPLTDLETRDGRIVEHEPYSEEQKAADDAKAAQKKKKRVEAAEQARKKNAKEQFKDQLLLANDGHSFGNITKFLTELSRPLKGWEKREAAEALAQLAEKLDTPAPAVVAKIKKSDTDNADTYALIVETLCNEGVGDAVAGMCGYLTMLNDEGDSLRADMDEEHVTALVDGLHRIIDEAESLLGCLGSVAVTATALWSVQTADMTKSKGGLLIKLNPPSNAPVKVDVLDGMRPGRFVVGGKGVNLGEHALLIMPRRPEDATVEPFLPDEEEVNRAAR